jgi:ABC-type multidrug transport system ATPase subunit
VPLVTAVCDYVYVLNFGKLLAEGDPDHVRNHPEVVAAYLGGEAPEELEATEAPEEQAAVADELAEVAPPAAAPAPEAADAPRRGRRRAAKKEAS